MSPQTKIASSSREQFLQIVQEQLAKFERDERELRKTVKADRARELRLPDDLAH